MLKASAVVLAAVLVPSLCPGATLTFEAPDYAIGTLASVPSPARAIDLAFNGQQGWSMSSSGAAGVVIASSSSGSYVGGQALTASISSTGNATYIGAQQSPGFGTGGFSFDMLYKGINDAVYVGGWKDVEGDGLFDQTDGQLTAGQYNTNGGVPTGFGFRDAGFGARHTSGVNPVVDKWYHIQVALDDATFTASMSVFNLTDNVPVDLNPNDDGTTLYSYTWANGTGYGSPSTGYDGLVIRVTGTGAKQTAVDNIGAIPEPASLGLFLLGSSLLVLRRRVC